MAEAKEKPRFEVHKRALRLSLSVEASNGYKGWIATEGHRRVTLTLQNGNTLAEARTSGRVTRHGIEASFGDLGRVSVRFRGKPFDLSFRDRGEHRCRGRKSALEEGLFSGTIRFRGENGFARIDSKRARGYVERHYRRACVPDSRGNPLGIAFDDLFRAIRLTSLQARARIDRANIFFEASAIDFSPLFGPGTGLEYIVSARSVEHRGGVRLTRSISTEGGEGSFLFSHRKGTLPRSATVAAPKPFTGTAKYLAEPGLPASWAGPLAAHLPGAGLVALTGARFRAGLCRLTLAALLDRDGCLSGPRPGPMRWLARLGRDPS